MSIKKKRDGIFISSTGEKGNAEYWANKTNISRNTMYARLVDLGWSVEKAISTPLRKDIFPRYKNRLYRIWVGIESRCNNKTNSAYDRYGGRGIKCLWKSFNDFERDMRDSYDTHKKDHGIKNTTLDRMDNDGHYSKDNCRWATYKDQARNRRNSIEVEYLGKTQSLLDWESEVGIDHATLWNRLFTFKWTKSKAFTTPPRRCGRGSPTYSSK